jgi:hypothetical protein
MRRSALAGAAAVAVLAVATPALASAPRTTTPNKIVLTVSSSGSTQTVAVGTRIVVALKSSLVWSDPTSSDTTVVVPVHQTGNKGSVRATFAALAPGAAQLTAEGRPNCTPRQACPQFVLLWQVTINVT